MAAVSAASSCIGQPVHLGHGGMRGLGLAQRRVRGARGVEQLARSAASATSAACRFSASWLGLYIPFESPSSVSVRT